MDSLTANINAGLGGENNNVCNLSLVGGTITGSLVAPTFPNVCPGCGRCRSCGHPAAPVAPYNPYPQVSPHWGPNTGVITSEIKSTVPTSGGVIALNGTNSSV